MCQNIIHDIRCDGRCRVIYSKSDDMHNQIYRVRECRSCGARQSTLERGAGPIRPPKQNREGK
uniref:hypothetical protein n=1 Tax=Schlesneria paludicola TaxID=360056 RepID=UPI0036F2CC38